MKSRNGAIGVASELLCAVLGGEGDGEGGG